MRKTLLICSIMLLSFNAITEQTHSAHHLEKYVDKVIRKEYYSFCREQKLKGCHMKAFDKAVRLKFKGE